MSKGNVETAADDAYKAHKKDTPSKSKLDWYFEIDRENIALSPKFPEVPSR
jgi:hypothetical protein